MARKGEGTAAALHLDGERLSFLSLSFELSGASWQGWDGVDGWDGERSEGKGRSNVRRNIQLENHSKSCKIPVQTIGLRKRGLPLIPNLVVVFGWMKSFVSLLSTVCMLPMLPFCSYSCSKVVMKPWCTMPRTMTTLGTSLSCLP